MTALANAFRRAAGLPENNAITSKFEIEQVKKKKSEEIAKKIEKLDEEQERSRFGYGEYERINDRGYKELGFCDNSTGMPRWFNICAQCGCHTMPNRGQGMLCYGCEHQHTLEMSHDY